MNGWTITRHVRQLTDRGPHTNWAWKKKPIEQIECRKKFGAANILITARYSETLVSMNGTATLTTFDLREMSEIMSYAQDCVHKGIDP